MTKPLNHIVSIQLFSTFSNKLNKLRFYLGSRFELGKMLTQSSVKVPHVGKQSKNSNWFVPNYWLAKHNKHFSTFFPIKLGTCVGIFLTSILFGDDDSIGVKAPAHRTIV